MRNGRGEKSAVPPFGPPYLYKGPWPHFLGPEQCPNEKFKIWGKELRDQ